jgi:hypothetical protein
MTVIHLCRGTGWGNLETLALPEKPYEWFLNLEIT